MINNAIITGRLVRDPDLRYTAGGKAVARFTVAVNRRTASDPDGADFINCVAWEKTADIIANYFKKGSLVGVEGSIKTGSFDKEDGTRIYTTDIQVRKVTFLETKAQAEANQGSSSQNQAPQQTRNQDGWQQQQQQQNTQQQPSYSPYPDPFESNGRSIEISDDDLPF